MRSLTRHFSAFLLSAALAAPVMLTACGGARVGVSYRYYDPYRSDYHVWNDGEGVFYNQWVIENHREHRDFRKLRRDDQRDYWRWRHDHPDHR